MVKRKYITLKQKGFVGVMNREMYFIKGHVKLVIM
jgi:hypothetical protein